MRGLKQLRGTLLDATSVDALAATGGTLALVASEMFYQEVILPDPATDPSSYRQILVTVKETSTTAWLRVVHAPAPVTPDTAISPAVAEQWPMTVLADADRQAAVADLLAAVDWPHLADTYEAELRKHVLGVPTAGRTAW